MGMDDVVSSVGCSSLQREWTDDQWKWLDEEGDETTTELSHCDKQRPLSAPPK